MVGVNHHRVRRSIHILGALLVSSALPSCANESARDTIEPVRRDSAGVRIVEHSGSPDPGRVIGLDLLYDYGRRPGEYSFTTVSAGALQPDGGAVISDGGNDEVVVIDPDGPSSSVLAAAGEGPGEVRQVITVHVAGQDEVWVEDDGNGKVVLFDDGELVESVNMQGEADLAMGLLVRGIDSEGRFLVSTSAFWSEAEGNWLLGHLIRFDPETRERDTLGTYEMAQLTGEESVNPFAPMGLLEYAGGHFVHVRTDRPELVWRRPDGSVRQILRWEAEPTYPTDEDWDAFLSAFRYDMQRVNPTLSGAPLQELVDQTIARYEAKPDVPVPLFGPIHVDGDGGVWLSEYVPGPSPRPRRYTLISPSGGWVGTVAFPHPFVILDVRNDRVLGVAFDQSDVQHIEVYRVAHGGSSS